MKFSIIIPVYNVEKYIQCCLDSLLNQTYTDWEAICIDDGSTDNGPAILDSYASHDNRFSVIHQVNMGLSCARNVGVRKATGIYILFLDSDDWVSKDFLYTLDKNSTDEDLICFSGVKYYEYNNKYSEREHLKHADCLSGMDYFNQYSLELKELHFDCAVSRAYKRSFLLNNNLYFKENIYHEDFLFTPQTCYYASKVKVIDECLYFYRIRSGSITTTESPRKLYDYIESNNELAQFFINKDIDKSVIYKRITQSYQIFILRSNRTTDRQVNNLINWKYYYTVSRSKIRHRFNFLLSFFSLQLARTIIKL